MNRSPETFETLYRSLMMEYSAMCDYCYLYFFSFVPIKGRASSFKGLAIEHFPVKSVLEVGNQRNFCGLDIVFFVEF